MPDFKYGAQFSQLAGCPPSCTDANGVAFRIVHDPIVPKDFEPKALQPSDDDDGPKTCGAWGLSMFTTAAAVQYKFGRLMRKYKNLAKDVGDSIASGTLSPSHGRTTEPNSAKHFNLYEYVDVNVLPLFRIVDKIKIKAPVSSPPPPGRSQ